MKNGRMQLKDLNTKEILQTMNSRGIWYSAFATEENSILTIMPKGTPNNLAIALMSKLIKQGLINGCTCGCRGNFQLTKKGQEYLK